MGFLWGRFLATLCISGAIALIWLGGTCFGEKSGIQKMQEAAVKAGVGQYNSRTAEFEFINK